MAVQPYKPLYTVKEVAKVLMINEPSVYQLMSQGKLPHITLGRKKIKGSDLERFIESYPTEPVTPSQRQEG